MRLIKMFGLAVIAAIASMAFLGASSAMAQSTALCTTNPAELACPTPYTGHVEATAGKTTLQTKLGTVTCEKSIILGNALTLGNPLVGHLELVDFSGNCNILGVGCTVETKKLGLLTLLKTGSNVGKVTSENTWVLVQCVGGGVHCEYGGTFDAGVATGSGATLSESSLGTVKAEAKTVQSREVLFLEGCPPEASWTAEYTIQLPHALFIKS